MKALSLFAVSLAAAGTAFSGILPVSDVPVWGMEMRLTDERGGPRNSIELRASNPSGAFPDPRVTGATAYIGRVGVGEVATIVLPASDWSVGAGARYYKFRSRTGTAVEARFRAGGTLELSARGDGAYPLGGVEQGDVGIIFDVAGVRFCSLFGGTKLGDDGRRFRARLASPPAACPQLGAPDATTSTSTSSSTTTSLFMCPPTTTSTTMPGGPVCDPGCIPDCQDADCGADGCGGSCGTCGSGTACSSGSCVPNTAPGSCAAPLDLTSSAVSINWEGTFSVDGDNTNGFDEVSPTCSGYPSPGPELVYRIVNQHQFTGVEFRAIGIDSGIDTVLSLRAGSCSGAEVLCNDDARPPGAGGSRLAATLEPNATYDLIVKGRDVSDAGSFTLEVRMHGSGCVPECESRFCGDDGCGGSCGECEAPTVCTAGPGVSRTCIAEGCQPDCAGRICGNDGCGGSCGTCGAGQVCRVSTSTCENACDHFDPVCNPGCSNGEYCGSDCACHPCTPQPDLVVDAARLASDVVIERRDVSFTSCAVADGCVNAPGSRRLLRFGLEVRNQGGAPAVPNRDDYQPSSCRGTSQLAFAEYALRNANGGVVTVGRKLTACVEDVRRALDGEEIACTRQFDCGNQGIQPGWSVLYPSAADCQWLDITDIPAGPYQLEVTVNPHRLIDESSFENNRTIVPVTIPLEP
jgi:hypothetical protein